MSATTEEGHVSRLVSFLGTRAYDEVIYRLGQLEAPKTRYVCRALGTMLRPSEIIVLATEQAEQRHGADLSAELRAGNCPAPRFVRIPLGRDPSELWRQFDVIKSELRNSTGPVMLDITHGFRSQPFFAAAVATFVHAVDENPPNLRVCYGAFEEKDPDTQVAPIWELSEFVTLLDWSRALAMFLRTGRAEEAGSATERLGRDLRKAWIQGGRQGDEPNLKELGQALTQFGKDLQTLRTGDLLLGRQGARSSATRLLEEAQGAKQHAGRHAPPLADVLEHVVAMAEPIAHAGSDLSGAEGRRAVVALAQLYLRLGRYLEATATVREGWVNLFAPKAALVPGSTAFDREERERAEDRAHKQDAVFREVTDRRNDFLHAQYRPGVQRAGDLTETVKGLVEKLRIASEAPRAAPGNCARRDCFVNLTNHPTATWSEAQLSAARALAERILDIPFPDVAPDADEKTIKALAESCVAGMPPETSHALVQGEFTLTVELVRRLQARGITCLAATSSREVDEDAAGRRTSTFTFVRFRAYPELAGNRAARS